MVPGVLQPESGTVICYRDHSRISKQRFLVQHFVKPFGSFAATYVASFKFNLIN